MAKFTFTFREVGWYDVEVEHDDRDAAEEIARERLDDGRADGPYGITAELAEITNHETGKRIDCL